MTSATERVSYMALYKSLGEVGLMSFRVLEVREFNLDAKVVTPLLPWVLTKLGILTVVFQDI